MFLTAISSIFVGTMVYVITKFVLDNLLEQRKVIADIAHALTYYANIYSASMVNDEFIKPTSDKFRELSARLRATITIIPKYNWLELFHIVLKTEDIKKAYGLLMVISNSIGPAAGETTSCNARENKEDAEEVEKLLKIK
jgi:hypothetical protein